MHSFSYFVLLAAGSAALVAAAPIQSVKRTELYPGPDLGRIKVTDDVEKREELYPGPDLGRIKVTDDVE